MELTPDVRGEAAWAPLYRLGAVAALLAVFVVRRNLGAELVAFRGFGLVTVPETVPVSAGDWFALLQSNALVGLALLNVFDLVEYALVALMVLALTVALWPTARSSVLIASACALAGVVVYFASNQAFAMLSLSTQYAAATTDAQRTMLLAAGESLLAAENPGRLIQGTATFASLFLVLVGGLIMSVAMWRSIVFGRITAATGILANGLGLGYYVVLPLAPALLVLPFVLSAPFRVVWYVLIARRLLRLGHEEMTKASPMRYARP